MGRKNTSSTVDLQGTVQWIDPLKIKVILNILMCVGHLINSNVRVGETPIR